MFFLLPTMAVVAETVVATIGSLAGTVAIRVATTIGLETVIATTLGTIAADGTTTALNGGMVGTGKSLLVND